MSKKPKKEPDSVIVTYIHASGIVAKAAVDMELLQPRAVSLDGEPEVWCCRIGEFGMIYALPGGVKFSANPPILDPDKVNRLIEEIQEVADICAGLNSEIAKKPLTNSC